MEIALADITGGDCRMMPKRRVLFVCVHNSARSQMAAALMDHCSGEGFEAESAGLDPGVLNPLAVEALAEVGIDISRNETQSVSAVLQSGRAFDFAITVCSEAEAEGCPVFPGLTTRLHWPFADPSKFTGTHEERLQQTRIVRDQIAARIKAFCEEQECRADENDRGG